MDRGNPSKSVDSDIKSERSDSLVEPPSVRYSSPTRAPWSLRPISAFIVLAALRCVSALCSPIADCDETFNYWEPMHYILFGYGFQTWEYSPEFALRSYAYLYPYALFAKLAMMLHSFLPDNITALLVPSPKIFAFYVVRLALGVTSAVAETFLYRATAHRFGDFVATLFLVFVASSPGVFRSAVEFLPSSFAMVSLTVAFAAWMQDSFFVAVFFVALAALLGWVFAAALAIPMALHILFRRNGLRIFVRNSVISAILILAFMIPIDSYYFGKLVIAPVNHVVYNVFPKDGAGSHIFGVDSWRFYAINLFLNCNIAAVMHASFPVVLVLGCFARLWGGNVVRVWERIIFLSPTYLAIAIFLSQPHKEERFLAPCYTFIALAAAVATVDWLHLFDRFCSSVKRGAEEKDGVRKGLRAGSCTRGLVSSFVAAACLTLGASRVIMQIKSFGAPLNMFQVLSVDELGSGSGPKNAPADFQKSSMEVNICIGKEWYRFPTSFFLPHKRFRVRFIRAGFTGLLPKPFAETRNGTRIMPSGMNEFNKEDPKQFYDWSSAAGCHYFVDLDLSSRDGNNSSNSLQHPIPEASRHLVLRKRFLDSERSSAGFRAFFVPGFDDKLEYGEYQVMRNIDVLPVIR